MKILLVNPLNYGFSSSPPLGIGYIASNLLKNAQDVEVFDAVPFLGKRCSETQIYYSLVEKIERFRPDVIGLSIMSCQLKSARQIVSLIRQKFGNNVVIVAGGVHPTVEPLHTFNYLKEIDFILEDEAETSFLEMVRNIDFKNVKGLYYRDGDGIKFTGKKEKLINIDSLPNPARELFDMEFYCQERNATVQHVESKATTILTSRGCPGRCEFCASNRIGLPVRWHSPEYVLNEVESVLSRYDVECISFVDTMFTSNKDRLYSICDLMIENRLHKKIRWTCSLRTDYVDEDSLKKMKDAGCFHLTFGIESGSQKILDKMNKQLSLETNRGIMMKAKEMGFLVNASCIYDFPGETYNDIKLTFDLISETKPYYAGLNKFTPLFGSPVYYKIINRNDIDNLIDECGYISSKYYNEFSKKDIDNIINEIRKIIFSNTINYYFYQIYNYSVPSTILDDIELFKLFINEYYDKSLYAEFIDKLFTLKTKETYISDFYIGNSYYLINDYIRARIYYENALKKRERPEIKNNYACVLYKLGECDRSQKIWNELFLQKDDYNDVRYNLQNNPNIKITKKLFPVY
ncbi:MAG: radical SAM protein [Candidatus Hydrogenedentota bacterium]